MASDSENFDSTMDSAGLSDFLLDKGISLEACNLLEGKLLFLLLPFHFAVTT